MKTATYDPAFKRAIAKGYLTLHQAIQRGNREVYAVQIAKKHGLPVHLALMVADNRLTLRAAILRQRGAFEKALRQKARAEPEAKPPPAETDRHAAHRQKTLLLGLALLALTAIVIYGLIW